MKPTLQTINDQREVVSLLLRRRITKKNIATYRDTIRAVHMLLSDLNHDIVSYQKNQ